MDRDITVYRSDYTIYVTTNWQASNLYTLVTVVGLECSNYIYFIYLDKWLIDNKFAQPAFIDRWISVSNTKEYILLDMSLLIEFISICVYLKASNNIINILTLALYK